MESVFFSGPSWALVELSSLLGQAFDIAVTVDGDPLHCNKVPASLIPWPSPPPHCMACLTSPLSFVFYFLEEFPPRLLNVTVSIHFCQWT